MAARPYRHQSTATAVRQTRRISAAPLVVLGLLFAVAGCSRSSDRPALPPQEQPPLADHRQPAAPVTVAPDTPGERGDAPSLSREEIASGHIGHAAAPSGGEDESTASSAAVSKIPASATTATDNAAPASFTSDARAPGATAADTTAAAGNPLRADAGGAVKSRVGHDNSEPFDPIKVNGSIFDGWSKPRLALLITGMEHGYIEPCGCAGLERMKGGMTRRHTLFNELREKGWPVVGLDVGGIAHGSGLQALLKFQTMVEGKRQMGYQAIALGVDDLALPAAELLAVAAPVNELPSPFVSANVGLFELGADMPAAARIVDVAGVKVGITSVLGEKYRKTVRNTEVKTSDAVAALRKIVPELKKKANLLVLLAHATREESIALGKAFPEFRVVVTSDSPPEPPKTFRMIDGTKTYLIEVGHKGMDAIVLGLFDDPKEPWRYQRVPLDSRFAASAEMKMLMTAYQDQVKAIGFAGLGIRAVPHPLKATLGNFVGSKKCESCHDISYDVWKKSGHAHAYDTLTKLDPPRNFDPECISCHVVGWHPTQYFPYEGGFVSQEKTPHLTDTGCEDCHGPGEKHVAAELSGSEADRQTYRKAVVVTKAESERQQCISCHDGDNSPDFNFTKYWPHVEHKEKE